MFENIIKFFTKMIKKDEKSQGSNSKEAAKERLHLVLMQDRANVSVDFLELMKQEIIEVIKKYIEVDEKEIDVRLTNKENEDGTNGAPALYANIPILNIKNDARKVEKKENEKKKTDEKEELNKKDIEKKQDEKAEAIEERDNKANKENKEMNNKETDNSKDKDKESDSNNEKAKKEDIDKNKKEEKLSKKETENKQEKELI